MKIFKVFRSRWNYVTINYCGIKNRRQLNKVLNNIKRHRRLFISHGHGYEGTKTKIWGTNLRGQFDTRKGNLYITYYLGKPKLDEYEEEEE